MADQEPPVYDEKWDEKRGEKEEKVTGVGGAEKWRSDPLSVLVWAGILVMAGLILLVDNLGLLPGFLEGKGWSLAFLVAGGMLFVEALVRFLIPEYRRPLGGTLILGAVFAGIGLSGFGLAIAIWPLILIGIGVSILVRAMRQP